MTEWTEGGKTLRLKIGNIALLDADALVNAANTSLILGGGVAGAIKAHGGPEIQQECSRIGPIEVGEAVLTGGGSSKPVTSSMPRARSMVKAMRTVS
jgi:O-acetyl-ADP-ribose deacetylase (regulator of RNase III)